MQPQYIDVHIYIDVPVNATLCTIIKDVTYCKQANVNTSHKLSPPIKKITRTVIQLSRHYIGKVTEYIQWYPRSIYIDVVQVVVSNLAESMDYDLIFWTSYKGIECVYTLVMGASSFPEEQ